MIDDIAKQNEGVKAWSRATFQEIKNRYMRFVKSPERSGDGLDNLKANSGSRYGEIDRVGFKFNRYLVFVHKGAGRGHGGLKGSVWTDRFGKQKKTRSGSLGKMNTGTRREEPWLNPVLDERIPELADIVAGFKADAVVKAIQIK